MIINIIYFILLAIITYYLYVNISKRNIKVKYLSVVIILFILQSLSIFGNVISGYPLFKEYININTMIIFGELFELVAYCLLSEIALILVLIQYLKIKKSDTQK